LQIEKLLQQAADKEKELLALLELTPIQIWNTDLDRFLEEWEVSVQRSVAFSLCVYACFFAIFTPCDRKHAKSGNLVASALLQILKASTGTALTCTNFILN
jgi:hypothetical protein